MQVRNSRVSLRFRNSISPLGVPGPGFGMGTGHTGGYFRTE